MITLPDSLNLGHLPADMYLKAYFTQLNGFAECVHILASSRSSPYPAEAYNFAVHVHLFDLMSGVAESRGAFKAVPRLYSLGRLAVLLYIHAIFLENQHSSVDLKAELGSLRDNLSKIQTLERHITLESLTLMILKQGKRDVMINPERIQLVLRMITIVKKMSTATLDKMLDLFFGYLIGTKYDDSERASLWNIDEMEKEAFGSS